jgi:GDPmannose 4,6-dehydratase
MRPTDLRLSLADPAKASDALGWRAQYKMKDVIKAMLSV